MYNLADNWVIYLNYKDLGKFYTDNLEKLIEIDTIEKFWQTYNNIPKTYDIFSDGYSFKKIKRTNATPCGYCFFRNGISPFWEDEKNKDGFEFSFRVTRNFEKFEKDWLYNLVELIGKDYENINGIRVVDCTKMQSVMYRMEFWFDGKFSKENCEKILTDNFNVGKLIYRSHKNIKEIV